MRYLSAKVTQANNFFYRRPYLTILLVFFLLGAFLFQDLTRFIVYDEAQYRAYLSSLLLDRDLDLSNDYELARIGFWDWDHYAFEQTITGAYDNKFSIGPAIMWTPFFLIGHLLTYSHNLWGERIALDGYTLLYDASLIFEMHLLTLLALFLLYRLGVIYFRPTIALIGALVIFGGSFWPLYTFGLPLWSHNLTIGLSVLFWWAWRRYHNDGQRGPVWPLALVSTFLILVRWQNLLLVAAAMAYSLFKIAHLFFKKKQRAAAIADFKTLFWWGMLVIVGLLPQGFVWYFQNGSFLTVPQGADFLHWTEPELIPLLFSSWHGLFFTHPLLLLGVVGLFLSGQEQMKPYRFVFIVAFIPSVYLNSIVDDWWAGISLGMRRFDAFIPLMALGLMQLLTCLKRPFIRAGMTIFSIVVITLNLYLTSLVSQDLIHSGFPLSQQLDLIQTLIGESWQNPLLFLQRSSPLGDLAWLLLRGQPPTGALTTWLLFWVMILGLVLVLRRWRLRSTSLALNSPYYSYPFLLAMVFISGWIIYAAQRTDFTAMQQLSLAKAEFLAGNYEAAGTIFNNLESLGRCDVDYLGWEMAGVTGDVDFKYAVGRRLLKQCGPAGWLRLAKTVERNPKILALSEAAEQKLIGYASWHPHHSYILLTLAQTQQKKGNRELALNYLEIGLTVEPDQPHLRWTLAGIYHSLGQIDQAVQHFRLVRGYLGLYAYANLSEMLAFRGDEQASLTYLEQAGKLKSGEPWGILDIADYASRTGRYEMARVEYNNALQQRPKRTLGIWYPLTSKWEGNAWWGFSKIMPAENQQKMACLAAQSAYAYAMDTHHELIELSVAYNNVALAKTMLKNEQFDQAADYLQRSIDALRRKISIQNSAVKIRLLTVDELKHKGDTPQHLTSIYLPLTRYYHPRTAFHPLPDLAELSAQARANAQTELDNNAALLIRLDMFEAQLAQIALAPANETKAAALTALETALAEILSDSIPYIYWWTPKDISEVYISRVEALRCLGRVEEAGQVLLEAGRRYPENPYVFLNIALLQAANDNPHKAETSFRRAIECEPGNYWPHFDYARFLADQGNYALARAEIAKAIAIAPGKAIGYNQLGHILYKAGNPDEATQAYHQAMVLEPGWYAMYGGTITLAPELRLSLQIINPTDSPYVYTYVWSDNQVQRYLLDDSSKPGKKYEIEWLIQPQKIWLQGEYQQQVSAITALSDRQPLAVAVSFQNGPDSNTSNIYERRYRFRLLDDNQLEIVLPPETWHNPRFPIETWRMTAIDDVMREK